MIEKFVEIKPADLNENAIDLIGNEWMLITAGNLKELNTMTAAWGGLGYLWNMPVVFIFIRPQRYTYGFVEKHSSFSLSFFERKHRDILNFCGKYSGRDFDKISETGLKAFESADGNILFQQAKINMECTKLYYDDIKKANFIFQGIDNKIYPQKDYHRFYIGKIEHLWIDKKIKVKV